MPLSSFSASNGCYLSIIYEFIDFCLRYEGRNWYTEHRGLLWVCSGNKPSDPKEDIGIEKTYAQLWRKQNGAHCVILIMCAARITKKLKIIDFFSILQKGKI